MDKNSVDPDQLASLEASWSVSTLFFKKEHIDFENVLHTLYIWQNMEANFYQITF